MSIDSLPYLDQISDDELKAAESLVHADAHVDPTHMHPRVPRLRKSVASQHFETLVSAVANGQPCHAVDLSRYSTLTRADGTLDYEKAAVALTHTQNSISTLQLLSKHGQNQWLVANHNLETMVEELKRNVAQHDQNILTLNRKRKTDQTASESALRYLESRWRDAIRNMVQMAQVSENSV